MKRFITMLILMMTMVTTMMAKDVISERGVKFLKSKGYRITIGEMYDEHAKLMVQQDSYTSARLYIYEDSEKESLIENFEYLTDIYLDDGDIEQFEENIRIFYDNDIKYTLIKEGNKIIFYEIKSEDVLKGFKRNFDNALKM